MGRPVLMSCSLDGLGGGVALHDGAVSLLSEMINLLGLILMPIILKYLLGSGVKLAT